MSAVVKRQRDSSIELLKIIAMVAIVASHVALSLQAPSAGGYPEVGGGYSFYVNFKLASADPNMGILVLLNTLGKWGNLVFVICSAWFLCHTDRVKLNKVIEMVVNVFILSVLFLAIALVLGMRPDTKTVLRCFLPTTFTNNWFIICYLLLYVMHPAMNWTIDKLGKRGHAALCIGLAFLYMVVPMFHSGHFFSTELMTMITEYVIVAFIYRHLQGFASDKKANLCLFLVGSLGMIAIVFLLEVAGQHIGFFADKIMHFDIDGDPLLFLSAIGLFNLVRMRPFVNAKVNRVAALMLFVYLIHENIMVRNYLRPWIWNLIYQGLGFDLLLVWLAVFSIGLFAAALVTALAYKGTFGNLVDKMLPSMERFVRLVGGRCVDWLCGLER